MLRFGPIVLALVLARSSTVAFQGKTAIPHETRGTRVARKESSRSSGWHVSALFAQVEESVEHRNARMQTSYRLSEDEIKPLFRIGSDEKEKLINAHGLWCIVVSLVVNPLWMLAMTTVNFVNKNNDEWDPNRAIFDKTGKIWAKAWLSLTNSYPTASGHVDYLQEGGKGACLYVANHASWLDIPVLCTVLDPVFKFIAKGELLKVPCIGQQLEGGNHILIDREDRRSQLRTFKEGINWLKKGVPIMAFPEGQRSPDGRLIKFKGGLFSMAVKTGVPIVPLSLSHTHAVFPSNALFPVQQGRGMLHVHVHEPIESKGRTDAELAELVRKAFLSELPLDHLPLEMDQTELIASSAVEAIKIESASQQHNEDGLHNHHHHQKHHHQKHHEAPTGHLILSVEQRQKHHNQKATVHIDGKAVPLYAINVKDELVEKL